MTKRPGSAHLIRRIIRECLALAFWIHAIYLTGFLPRPSLAIPELPRYALNACLIIFIVNYSLFSENGWWSVIFDALFIYFLPFIYAGRLFWWLGRISYKNFKASLVWKAPQLIIDRPATPTPAQAGQETSSTSKASESVEFRLARRLTRLFLKFALLWSLLVLTVNSKPLLVLAVLITFIGAAKAIWILWDIFSGGSSWVDNLEEKLALKIKELFNQIENWNESSKPEEIKQAINGLKFYRSVFNFITDNTAILTRWALTLSVLVSVPFYCYVSFLFACVYFGIAKVVGLDFAMSDAFVDSLYMPFAFSALPANILIRFIGGLQATCVAAIGYNIMFRHLGNRLDKISRAAAKLRNPFEEELLKARMQRVEDTLSNLNSERRATNNKHKALPKPRNKHPK